MIEVVLGRLSRSSRLVLHLALFAAPFYLALSLSAQITGGAAAAPAAPTSAPQIITVPVPAAATPAQQQNGPDWSRSQNNRDATTRDPAERSDRTTVNTSPDTPTEFQRLVAQSVGSAVPIFGAGLFDNAPSTFAPVGDSQVSADYVIGPGDELRISTSGQLNQQGSFTVDRSGSIIIPDVGAIQVAGLRFSELRSFLRQQIGRVYRNFELTVTLGQLRSIQVYVLGEARRPGAYTISSQSTLVNALFASGGVRSQGSLRNIQLRRGNQTVTTIDLYDLLLRGDKSKDVNLQPGDIIFIPATGPQVALLGSVTDPAIYELRGETTLSQLITLANGLTSTATETAARVESIYNHSQRAVQDISLQTSGNMPLHAGDIITIASISDQFKDAVTLRGNVAAPGRYPWHPGMRITDVIPTRESLLTRSYFRARNALGQPAQNFQPSQGRIAVSTSPSSGTNGDNGTTTADAPTPTARNVAGANGGGTTIGDALTQNNGTFLAQNDVVLSAPDVDLAYAVVERLDPVTLTTSLVPFDLGQALNGDATQNLNLLPGDVITIFSKADVRVPQQQQTRFVRLEGEFTAAGVYSVLPGETLRSLIARAGGLTPDAYLYAGEFTRESTRRVEQQRIREYADTLDAQITADANREISAAINPTGAAANTAVSVDNARAAVTRLRATQATGRIVLKLAPTAAGVNSIPDIALEDGDRFIVPRQPTSVSVAGQVYNASAFLFTPGLQVRNYLRDAGGPDRSADEKRIFIIRADGSVVSRQYANVAKATVLPGDTVIVPPQLLRHNILRDAVTISTAVSQIALGFSILALIR